MPLYEYACSNCGHQFERLAKRGAPAPAKCPACESEGTVSRLISSTNFQLKGSGWYVTDYKRGPSKPGPSSESSESSSSESTSSSSESSSSDSGGSSGDSGGGAKGSKGPGSDTAA